MDLLRNFIQLNMISTHVIGMRQVFESILQLASMRLGGTHYECCDLPNLNTYLYI